MAEAGRGDIILSAASGRGAGQPVAGRLLFGASAEGAGRSVQDPQPPGDQRRFRPMHGCGNWLVVVALIANTLSLGVIVLAWIALLDDVGLPPSERETQLLPEALVPEPTLPVPAEANPMDRSQPSVMPPKATGTLPPSTPIPGAGDAWTRPTDGAVMVYVPAGEFLMGSRDDDPDALGNEKPQHTVYLDGFWIDRTEVTNAQYRKCVTAGACDEPRYWDDGRLNTPTRPVVGVTWDDAQAYADWVGGRLPTEAEWEKAARGMDGRLYPWGDEFDCRKANIGAADCGGRQSLALVGDYPAGASPYGALDMAGNVWEWVADWYDKEYYSRSPERNPQGPDSGWDRVSRGGSMHCAWTTLRCAFRAEFHADRYAVDVGFRVVVDSSALPSGF